jgi:UDP-N-acetylmuramoyl-tripeptide--D-alanyl-D-alanine ligase
MKVCIDSRLVKSGEYFVPIKGENFDGHEFIANALDRGAAGVIEEDDLYQLALKKRITIKPIVIAVTGSVGKSTSTNFLNILLSTRYKTCLGNLNTKLGLATNIINDMTDDCEIFIAECGMDRFGELAETSEFLNPDIVVILNISESHIEKLGSIEAIKETKMGLIKHIKPEGQIFLNWENENIRDAIKYIPNTKAFENIKIIKYGNTEGSDFTNKNLEDFIEKSINELDIKFIGQHNYLNLLAASIVSIKFNLDRENLIRGLENAETPKGRLKRMVGIKGSILIDDTYNSSPVSCISALKSASDYKKSNSLAGRKIAILGGMLELGDLDDEGHGRVGKMLSELNFDQVVLVGDLAKKILKGINNPNIKIHFCENSTIAGEYIIKNLNPDSGDIILVKGSQGIRMEHIVKVLMKNPEEAKDLLCRQDLRWI